MIADKYIRQTNRHALILMPYTDQDTEGQFKEETYTCILRIQRVLDRLQTIDSYRKDSGNGVTCSHMSGYSSIFLPVSSGPWTSRL